jgi:hypothetical protein
MSGDDRDPERLRHAGRPEDRELLRQAGVPPVPPGQQDAVRRAVEARIARPARRRRGFWVGAGLGTFLAGTALAYGVIEVKARRERTAVAPAAPPPSARAMAPRRAETPDPEPAAAQEAPPAAAPPARPGSARRPPAGPRGGAPAADAGVTPPAPFGGPAWRRFHDVPEEPAAAAPRPEAPAPVLDQVAIDWAGRAPVRLRFHDGHLSGQARGVAVDLRLEGARLTGKVGAHVLALWFRHEDAVGTIAGRSFGFELSPKTGGHILRGGVPGHTVRVQLDAAGLAVFPGCERALPAIGPGVYDGTCAGGERLRVALPPAFADLPPLPRTVLLGLLLARRDAVLEGGQETLFPE